MAISELTRKEISALYVAYFNRAPDREGLLYWSDVAAAHTDADGHVSPDTLAAIAAAFSTSAEAQDALPWENDQALVNSLYVNVLGRAPNEEGIVPIAGGG